jgi:hypothetical protein
VIGLNRAFINAAGMHGSEDGNRRPKRLGIPIRLTGRSREKEFITAKENYGIFVVLRIGMKLPP